MTKQSMRPCVYIISSGIHGTLYTGVTSDLVQRVYQHKNETFKGFSAKYKCQNLVWYELHETMAAAIAREKQIKGGPRKKKIALIEAFNSEWKDLYQDVL